jgi:glycosyltransferase involved in cell wall biosynthesis
MRIAVVNWSSRKVGGTETYLDEVVPELSAIGHDVAFLCEFDGPADRPPIRLAHGSPHWCVAEVGAVGALAALHQWKPDVIYVHKLVNVGFHERAAEAAPGVFFVHDYYGTCISGLKTFKFPVAKPCVRRFGWQCLMHYFPHRCGGRSPVTMWRLFREQSRRLQLLRRYNALVTHSSHMRSELLKHGFRPERVHKSSYLVEPVHTIARDSGESSRPGRDGDAPKCDANRLLFLGRMDRLKGGLILLDALPIIADGLHGPVRVTFAGDGPDRAAWERRARRLRASNPAVRVEFTGWLDETSLENELNEADLLVVPSVWPEPFGRVGPEAGLRSLPVAAFGVGGISEWLIDGRNGRLAPGDPPTAQGLARAVIDCLRDDHVHEQLRRGALEVARQFNVTNHIGQLIRLFEKVAGSQALTPTERGKGVLTYGVLDDRAGARNGSYFGLKQ